ncbi:MAG: hypothetical protein RL065_2110 [Bacteroidota bacterium]
MKKVLFVFLVLGCYCKSFSQSTSIKNLVMEGGGIRGIAYVGAITELQQNHDLDSLQNVAGTSAGSILAALVAVGYTPDELTTILSSLKFQQFNDNEFGFISGSKRIITKYGWYKGNKFEKFMERLIATKSAQQNLTFNELHQLHLSNPNQFKELFVTATDVLSQQAVVMSYKNYPDMPISKAVRCSMSIPFYFKPVYWEYKSKDFSEIHYPQLLVDGGVLMNYPIHIFDSTYQWNETIGIRLDDSIESYNYNKQIIKNIPEPLKIKNFKSFTMNFYYLIMTSINDKNLTPLDAQRTIQISPGNIGQKLKKLKPAEVNYLVNNGKVAVKNFLKK